MKKRKTYIAPKIEPRAFEFSAELVVVRSEGAPSERHGMLPGTHEWPRTPTCRCGAEWSRWDDMCAVQFAALNEKEA